MDLTPQVLELLEKVRVAVSEGKFSEAEQLMIEVRNLINIQNPNPLPPRRKAGWC